MASEKPFNYRGFTSVITAASFLVMMVTGVVLYVVPPGRVAYWVDWAIFGLAKEEWGAVHIVSSLLFVAVGIIHLLYNWKPFVAYMVAKVRQKADHPRKEGVLGFAVVVVFVVGTMAGVPPFQYVLDFNEVLKEGWSQEVGHEPPFGHAEEVSLESLAYKVHIDADQALAVLKDRGLDVTDGKATLREIADANGQSPAQIYNVIWNALGPKPVEGVAQVYRADQVEKDFSGTGIGRKTLVQVADEFGVPVEIIQSRLMDIGVTSEPTSRLKDLGEAKGFEPMELLKTILVKGYTAQPLQN